MTTSEMRALERAVSQQIRVLVCVVDEREGTTDFIVTASSGDDVYTVREHGVDEYECNCTAGQHRIMCKHVMAVRMDGYAAPLMIIL